MNIMNYPPLNKSYIVCAKCGCFVVDDKVTINQAIHRGWGWKGEELVCPNCVESMKVKAHSRIDVRKIDTGMPDAKQDTSAIDELADWHKEARDRGVIGA